MVQRFHLLTTALINSLGDRHPDSWVTLHVTAVSKPSYSLETALSGLWDLTSSESWGRCWELMLVHHPVQHQAHGLRIDGPIRIRDTRHKQRTWSRPLLCCSATFTDNAHFYRYHHSRCSAWLTVFQRKTSSEELKESYKWTLEKLRTNCLILTYSFLYFSTKILHLNHFLLFKQGSTGHTDISPPVTLPLRHITLFPNESASIPRSFLLSKVYKSVC